MAERRLTVVMYHYVRPIAGSGYPRIKGLELAGFRGQLDYLERHYRIVRPADVLGCLREGRPLPDRAVLLTFDDGYKDHIRHAYPELRSRGITAAFFPPTCAVRDREMLDVNRVHFILAAVDDMGKLVLDLESAVESARGEFDLEPLESYRGTFLVPNRYDVAEVNYVKRMLQHALPGPLRARIARELFSRHVSKDERAFADDLYLDADELGEMAAGGMEIGSHGHRHHWLGRLGAEDQAADVDRSLACLGEMGLLKKDFWFCYPYGSYNSDTLGILKERGCAAAVTVEADLACCLPGKSLELARLDTNDLPLAGDAAPSAWTKKASAAHAPSGEENRNQ